ncbi:MAG: DUF6272 family protein [Schleiferiaceae bacterium]|nr:DUF6272 family protein [Schleiferiaceae bacterium]
MREEIIGDYNVIPDSLPAEGDVFVRVKPIDMISYWKRCGLMADFTASFYAFTREDAAVQENIISTVFNELIENATKYSVKRSGEVSVNMKMYDTVLKIQVENQTTQNHFAKFKAHIQELLATEDLDQLYMDILVSKTSDTPKESGIGLLLLLKDYGVKLGVKFEEDQTKDLYKTTIQAYYFFEN